MECLNPRSPLARSGFRRICCMNNPNSGAGSRPLRTTIRPVRPGGTLSNASHDTRTIRPTRRHSPAPRRTDNTCSSRMRRMGRRAQATPRSQLATDRRARFRALRPDGLDVSQGMVRVEPPADCSLSICGVQGRAPGRHVGLFRALQLPSLEPRPARAEPRTSSPAVRALRRRRGPPDAARPGRRPARAPRPRTARCPTLTTRPRLC